MGTKLIAVVSVGFFLFFSTSASAVEFAGSAIGSWLDVKSDNPAPDYPTTPVTNPSMDIWDVENDDDGLDPAITEHDTALFWWGSSTYLSPYSGTLSDTGSAFPRSEFIFDGVGSDGAPGVVETDDDEIFAFGDFTYNNGDNYNSATVNGVDLFLDFMLTDNGATSFEKSFNLTASYAIANTANTENDSDTPVSDTVTLTNFSEKYTFEYDSISYDFEILGFGILDEFDDLSISNFIVVAENATAERQLYAKISETPVPEPATLVLFSVGLLGLSGMRLRKKKL